MTASSVASSDEDDDAGGSGESEYDSKSRFELSDRRIMLPFYQDMLSFSESGSDFTLERLNAWVKYEH